MVLPGAARVGPGSRATHRMPRMLLARKAFPRVDNPTGAGNTPVQRLGVLRPREHGEPTAKRISPQFTSHGRPGISDLPIGLGRPDLSTLAAQTALRSKDGDRLADLPPALVCYKYFE